MDINMADSLKACNLDDKFSGSLHMFGICFYLKDQSKNKVSFSSFYFIVYRPSYLIMPGPDLFFTYTIELISH